MFNRLNVQAFINDCKEDFYEPVVLWHKVWKAKLQIQSCKKRITLQLNATKFKNDILRDFVTIVQLQSCKVN